MGRLDLYIAKHVLAAMAIVLLVLGGLDLLFTAVDELGDTSERYGSIAALQYVLLTFPRHVYELLPMSALIGALAGLGMLATGNELVVMQAAGVSTLRIVRSVMKPALLVMLFGLLLGEYVAPAFELRAEVNKAVANGERVGLSRYGHWERDGNRFLHFNAMEADGMLFGVSLLEFDDQQRIVRSVEATRAVYSGSAAPDIAAPGQAAWALEQGRELLFVYDTEAQASSTQHVFVTLPLALDLTPDVLRVLIVDPDRMAMRDLWRHADRFVRQGQDASPYYLAFWKKVLQPLTTALLVLVAISFIFGPLREATMGSRVFTAICFGLGFTILQRLLHNIGLVYQLTPVLVVSLPLLVTALLGLYFFRRAV
jgi:lipopolysaccharide export system permease protein